MRGWNALPAFSQAVYKDTYFLPGEDYPRWLSRVSRAYQNDDAHGMRMMQYISSFWFHPSTPPSSNGGTDRGLPISCYTSSIPDSKTGIFGSWNEFAWLGAGGGGIGRDWSVVREINHQVGKHGGKSSGIIPFNVVDGTLSRSVSQGGIRRASVADYLDISHPEIEEFIDIRKPTGDQTRRSDALHHGIIITDDFMRAVISDCPWDLISPKDRTIVKTVQARKLWHQIMEVRATLKGEPYLLFIDTVNKMSPAEYKAEDIKVTTSNLCTEVTLRTDETHNGVCCLGSINLEFWDEYQVDDIFDLFIADVTDYLDNILQSFIDLTGELTDPLEKMGYERARNGAIDERSIGLGVMGLHSLFQSKMIPWESPMAKGLNLKIFKRIKESADKHNNVTVDLACPMSLRSSEDGQYKRNIHVTAIAPTMSISSLCNVASSGVEPWVTNAFTKKVQQGSFAITNKFLDAYIHEKCHELMHHITWIDEQWASIKKHDGSVQHLDWMPQEIKDVFKTAFEIDQKWVIELAGDRQPFVDQAQSINLFIPGNSHVQYIADLHVLAWKKKLKSLYYLRSSAVNKASTASNDRKVIQTQEDLMSDACVGCT